MLSQQVYTELCNKAGNTCTSLTQACMMSSDEVPPPLLLSKQESPMTALLTMVSLHLAVA